MESDFIFSAIAEEMGVLVSVCLLLICVAAFLTFMKNAMALQDPYYRLVSVGLGVMYIFQVFLTVGGGIKFIPLTGVTLPFVSYGGSSVLVSIVIFMIMQGIILRAKDETLAEDEDDDFEDEDEEFDEEDEEEEEKSKSRMIPVSHASREIAQACEFIREMFLIEKFFTLARRIPIFRQSPF